MDKQRLLELAGVPLNEEHDWENAEQIVSKMADLFEEAIDRTGLDSSHADEFAEAVNDLMDMFHEELKERGLMG